jgi:hypothetical protein
MNCRLRLQIPESHLLQLGPKQKSNAEPASVTDPMLFVRRGGSHPQHHKR